MLEVIRKSILNDSEQFKTKLWALFFFDTPRWSRSPAMPKWCMDAANQPKLLAFHFRKKRVGNGPLRLRYTSISGQRLWIRPVLFLGLVGRNLGLHQQKHNLQNPYIKMPNICRQEKGLGSWCINPKLLPWFLPSGLQVVQFFRINLYRIFVFFDFILTPKSPYSKSWFLKQIPSKWRWSMINPQWTNQYACFSVYHCQLL